MRVRMPVNWAEWMRAFRLGSVKGELLKITFNALIFSLGTHSAVPRKDGGQALSSWDLDLLKAH